MRHTARGPRVATALRLAAAGTLTLGAIGSCELPKPQIPSIGATRPDVAVMTARPAVTAHAVQPAATAHAAQPAATADTARPASATVAAGRAAP
jgi:hypothetical protein